MKAVKSKNAQKILSFIAERGFGTLYEIHKEKGIARSSIDQSLQLLRANNYIRIDPKESLKRKRHAIAYRLTFKGLIVFLSGYNLPEYVDPVRGYRSKDPNESDEEAAIKLQEQMKKEWYNYKPQVDEFGKILQKNGKLHDYPLFQYCQSFQNVPTRIPEVYQNFIKIAQAVLREVSSKGLFISADQLRKEKKKLEKSLENTKKLVKSKKIRMITTFGGDEKVVFFDPVAKEEQILDYTKDYLRIIFDNENEFLKESFFMQFLNMYRVTIRANRFKLPNQDLFGYTELLLKKEKERFKYVEQMLEKWLTVFSIS